MADRNLARNPRKFSSAQKRRANASYYRVKNLPPIRYQEDFPDEDFSLIPEEERVKTFNERADALHDDHYYKRGQIPPERGGKKHRSRRRCKSRRCKKSRRR
jgi:hypothetical protein